MDWFSDEEKPMDQVTVREFQSLIDTTFKQRALVEDMEAAAAVESAKLEKLKKKCMAYLSQFGKSSEALPGIGTISVAKRLSVSHPKEPEAKAAFFEYLKNKGIFEDMVTVNSQTLNSWYRQEFELAKDEGRLVEIPGVGEPNYVETLSMKKGK